MTTNLVKNITQASDLEQLIPIISGVIGETCWKASLSYGDELTLHLGARIPYSQKSMVGKEKGSWILGTRATQWRLDSECETLVTSNDSPEIIRHKVVAIKDSTITVIETNYRNLALALTFSNGCKLILLPNNEDEVDLPYWEMFTPHHMVIKVGPGAMWSYTSSNSRAMIMATDEDKTIVEAFFQVVKEQGFVFDDQSNADLSTIKQTLAELENQPLSVASNAIIAWYKQYPEVRDAVLFATREITIKKRNPANQEGTLINQFPDYKEIIDERQNNPPSEPNKK